MFLYATDNKRVYVSLSGEHKEAQILNPKSGLCIPNFVNYLGYILFTQQRQLDIRCPVWHRWNIAAG